MLTSLPSLLIIPFVLLAGKLSVGKDKLKILAVGLSIFFLSGVYSAMSKEDAAWPACSPAAWRGSSSSAASSASAPAW